MSRQPENEHGTLVSYIVGFLLSLLLTFSAYSVVVNRSFRGTGLLAVILELAVFQMAVQIFFFLHLGRGPKPLYNVVFFIGTVGIVMVVVLGSVFIMDNLHYNMAPSDVTKKLAQDEGIAQVNGEKTGACDEVHTNHQVVVSKDAVSPLVTQAQLCDSLTFINADTKAHDIAFGEPDSQDEYGGQSLVSIPKGYPKTITLNQAGNYTFHDLVDTGVGGTFTVNQ